MSNSNTSNTSNSLNTASALPFTAGAGLLFLQNSDPIIVLGMIIVTLVSLFLLVGTMSRYISNHFHLIRKNKSK